jgi:chemotaxis-related protein WspD
MRRGTRQDDCWNRIGVGGDGSCPRLQEFVHCRNCPVYAGVGKSLFDREPPADYLAEWQARLAEEKDTAAVSTLSVLIFRVGVEWFGLPTRCLERVTGPRPVKRIPHRSNALLTGLVNVEGELLLAFSFAAVLELAPPPPDQVVSSRGHLLVVTGENGRWALAVDEIEGVVRMPAAAVSEPPVSVAKSSSALSTGVIAREGPAVALLDGEAVFRRLQQAVNG